MEITPLQKQILLLADLKQPAFNALKNYLDHAGFGVAVLADYNAHSAQVRQNDFNLVILDLDLPGPADGTDYQSLRREIKTPILLVSHNIELANRLVEEGLPLDDYLIKPFNPYKATARVHAIFHHMANEQAIQDVIFLGDLIIDLDGHTVMRDHQNIGLSRTEFKILALFAQYPQKIFSRTQLIELLKGNSLDLGQRTIDAHIKNLREKLERNPKKPSYIQTVYGFGYKFEA
jgi:DNA-binding response OmpR family regulator